MTTWLLASGGLIGAAMGLLVLYYRGRATRAEASLAQLNTQTAAERAELEKLNAERAAALEALKRELDSDEAKDRSAAGGVPVVDLLRSGLHSDH